MWRALRGLATKLGLFIRRCASPFCILYVILLRNRWSIYCCFPRGWRIYSLVGRSALKWTTDPSLHCRSGFWGFWMWLMVIRRSGRKPCLSLPSLAGIFGRQGAMVCSTINSPPTQSLLALNGALASYWATGSILPPSSPSQIRTLQPCFYLIPLPLDFLNLEAWPFGWTEWWVCWYYYKELRLLLPCGAS